MWPDESFAPARGSFLIPVVPPGVDPDASPTQAVSVNCEYLPYIRGALQQLLLQATWKTSDPAVLLLTQQRMFNLIDLFQECSGGGVPFACPFDFTVFDNGFFKRTGYNGPGGCADDTIGDWTLGEGWGASLNSCPSGPLTGVDIQRTFSPAVNLNQVAVTFDYVRGGFNTDSHYAYALTVFDGASVVAQELIHPSALPTGHYNKVLDFSTGPVTDVVLTVISEQYGTPSGNVSVRNLTVFGVGDAPC